MIRRFWIEFRKSGEPVFVFYKRDNKGNTQTSKRAMFFWLRRINLKIENVRIKKYLISQGHEPIRCQGCGEGWCEHTIENPNKPEGTKDRWKVCRHCVSFYDIKWTNQRLYKPDMDFRG